MITKILISPFFLLAAFLFLCWQAQLPVNIASTEEISFTIEKGRGLGEIAAGLEKQGLIKSAFFFKLYVFSKGTADRLQAGIYLFSPSMKLSEIAKKIAKGEVATESFTIPEGWNLKDIAWFFENKGEFQAEELYGLPLKIFSNDFDFLRDAPSSATLEGYLFPDTYQLKQGQMTAEIIAQTMLENFGKKITPDLRAEIKRQKKTLFEIITMASLLEREAKTLEEKKLVSGILWKRLRVGMLLQVDATVAYALSALAPGTNPDRITYEQTRVDSPYNTYRYAGLPLGPISNPGLESILAAIYPQENDYWYYLATPEGKTFFSQTLEQHNIKKVKYLNR